MRVEHPILGPVKVGLEDVILVVSDLHLNHNKEFLWGKRSKLIPDERKAMHVIGVESYTDFIISELMEAYNMYSRISNNVYLLSLGDTCFNDADSSVATRFASLPFKHIFLLGGNHTSGIKQMVLENKLPDNVTLLAENIPMHVRKGVIINLSHYPPADFATGTYGALCGHCHGAVTALNAGNSELGRVFDCGVENALKLKGTVYFTLDECINYLQEKHPINREERYTS